MVDATETPEIVRALAITGVPTLIGYRNGAEIFWVLGRRSRADLDQKLDDAAGGLPEVLDRGADRLPRTTSGAAIIAMGAISGPAWPLVVFGALVTAWGLRS